MTKATLFTDGGSRGNPGPAGIGYVLTIEKKPVITVGKAIGIATNNQAEYGALIAGLARAAQEGVTQLGCFLDSELVVKQMQKKYRVKDIKLQPLFHQARDLLEVFEKVTFAHVPRAKNAQADALVNEALDRQK